MTRSLPVENLLPQHVGSIITYLQYLLKYPNVDLLVAVDHNQLRTMASETVDPIHPPPSWAVPPERLVNRINRCSSATGGIGSCNLQHARQPPCLCGHSVYSKVSHWTIVSFWQESSTISMVESFKFIVFDRRIMSFREKTGNNSVRYRKWGTHARVLSQTRTHMSSKNEMRQRNRKRR